MANGLLHLSALQNIYEGSFISSSYSYMNSRNDGLRNLIDRISVNGGSWNPVLSAFRGTFLEISSRLRRRDLVNDDPMVGILMAKVFMKGLVSAVSMTAEAPFQRVKLLLQNEQELIKSGRLSAPFNGITGCFARIIKNEGVISLWRGNSVNLIKIFPDQVLRVLLGLVVNSIDFNFTKNNHGDRTSSFLRSLIVDVCSYTCFYSLEYAHTRLATDVKCVKSGGQRKFNGFFDVYKKTLKSAGIVGFFRGYHIGYVNVIIDRGYHFANHGAPESDPSKKLSTRASLLIGPVLSLIAYPFDTVQRRMMMTSGEASKYKSSIDAFRQIIKNEGILSLYKGYGAYILGMIPMYLVLTGYLKLERRSDRPFGGISVVIETK